MSCSLFNEFFCWVALKVVKLFYAQDVLFINIKKWYVVGRGAAYV